MESPAVSGATDYQSLCLAAKTEEKRLAEIKKRRQYLNRSTRTPVHPNRTVQTLDLLANHRAMVGLGERAPLCAVGIADGLVM